MRGKRIKVFFYAIIAAVIFIMYPSVKAYASDNVTIESIDMKVNLLENGDVYVEEYLSMKFDGKFNGAFRDLSANGTGGIEDFKAYIVENGSESEFYYSENAKKGDYGVYKVEEKKENLYRVQIFVPSKNVTRNFKFTYKLKNCAVLYNDVGELYFNFWDKGYDTKVDRFKGSIILPKSSNEPLKSYVRGSKRYNDVIEKDDRISFEINDLGSKNFISARVIFSKDVLKSAAKVEQHDGKQMIIDKEKKYDEAIAKKEADKIFFGKVMKNLFLLFTAINIPLIILFSRKTKRGHIDKSIKPKLCSPAMAARLTGIMGNGEIFIGTILDLSQRGYIDLEGDEENKNNYILTLREEKWTDLLNHEKYFLTWLKDISGNSYRISTDEIEEKMKDSKSGFSEGFNKWIVEIGKEYSSLGYGDKSKYGFGGILLVFFVAELFVSIGLCINFSIALGILGILESVIIFILAMCCFVRMTDEGYREKASWKYLKDKFENKSFKDISKEYPLDVYMPYFIALGVGPDIFKSFKNFAISSEDYKDNLWLNNYFAIDGFTKGHSFIYLTSATFSGSSMGGNISTGGGGGVGGGGAGGF